MTQNSEPNLRIPGPVPLPEEEVLQIAAKQMINHRGPEYADMLERMSKNLRTVLMTKNDVYFITSSGTGAMETAVFNTVSPATRFSPSSSASSASDSPRSQRPSVPTSQSSNSHSAKPPTSMPSVTLCAPSTITKL